MKRFTKLLGLMLSLVLAVSALVSVVGCKESGPEKVTVTYLRSDGSTFRTDTVNKGSVVNKPTSSPSLTGNEFGHWYSTDPAIAFVFSKPVIANVTLQPFFYETGAEVFTIGYYTRFNTNVNDFVTDDLIFEITVPKGFEVKDPVEHRPTAQGEIFVYWRDIDNNEITFPFNIQQDINVGARMDKSCLVKFATQGGSLVESQNVRTGQRATRPDDPTRSGFDFLGWITTSGEEFDFDSEISEDITIYAKWLDLGTNPPDNKMLVVSSSELDGVFHPFFSTSAPDGTVHSQTQVGLISSSSTGAIDMGHHVPTVAQDYSQITYAMVDGIKTPNPTAEDLKNVDKTDPYQYWTEYEFLIKNGIKFDDHDNQELTIKDVIFNMYVYLDPMYTGSNTLYSTPIQGLLQYQTQDPDAVEGVSGGMETYRVLAKIRQDRISNYFSSHPGTRESTRAVITQAEEEQLVKDVQWLRERYYQELTDNWNTLDALGIDEEDKTYKVGYRTQRFTKTEEIFAYHYSMIVLAYQNGQLNVGDSNYSGYNQVLNELKSKIPNPTSEDIKNAFINKVFHTTMGIYTDAEQNAHKLSALYQGYPKIDLTFNSEGDVNGTELESELLARFRVYSATDCPMSTSIRAVAFYTISGQDAMTEWTKDEQTKAIKNQMQGGRKAVETISGITVGHTSEEKYTKDGKQIFQGMTGRGGSTTNFNQVEAEAEGQYILRIRITGIDPKAIWNFGFPITPMFYYSSTQNKSPSNVSAADWLELSKPQNDYRGFNYRGCPGFVEGAAISPGFVTHDSNYFNGVFKDPTLIRVPRGAGAFKATNAQFNGAPVTSGSQFYSDKLVNFTYNSNFKTTGQLMSNVKFRNMRYQVLESTRVLSTLKSSSTLHYGDVNAKEDNLKDANNTPHLTALKIDNNGYGYVGVNASFVPDINIRKAIMTVMNTDLVKTYYGSMAEIITRPMTTNSWAYPDGAPDEYPFNNETSAKNAAAAYVTASGGYSKDSDGVWARTNPITSQKERLEYTFTIAGAEKDHPAYNMFSTAARILNEVGFKITVYTDSQALIKLASGQLAVWAAAWTSGIDPDMYQVYHKESQAQSVQNWGYPYLLDEKRGTPTERGIISRLSTAIEEARDVMDEGLRAGKYATALQEVMNLAVEYPTYQRYNLIVYNNNVIDFTTLNTELSAYSGPMDRIWEVRLL